jgi:DNA polymerase-3 subunit epsilon
MKPDGSVKEYRTLVNPGISIPPGATAVHGITDAMVQGCRLCDRGPHAPVLDATDPHEFRPWPFFVDIADGLLRGFVDCDFAGYNVRFDLRMFAAEFKRCKRTWDYEGARVIDGFRLWQVAEQRSLTDAVERFLDKETREALNSHAHTAMGDVRWSTRVIANQLRVFPQLPRDMQQLHDLCSPGWFDAEGKMQWRNGELCLSFGQHRDTSIKQVPKSYLSWMAKGDFSAKIKNTCRDALLGIYPVAPVNCEEP